MNRSRFRPGTGALAALLSFAAALPAQSAWKNLTGQPMPAIPAGDWLNTDGSPVTTEALLGKVWLFEFFATT